MDGYQPTDTDVLAALALGADQGHPLIEAVAAARAGTVEGLSGLPSLLLVDVLRMLAILGEWPAVVGAYEVLADHPAGAVHFEAGIAAQMEGDREAAMDRFRRACTGAAPQPMAWNSLAVALSEVGELDDAWIAVQAGLEAMPGDPITARTATAIAILRGDEASARALGFEGDVAAEQTAARFQAPAANFRGHAQMAIETAKKIMALPSVLGEAQLAAARHLMTRAVALDPSDERARRGLEALKG
jgi:hypothetical protein